MARLRTQRLLLIPAIVASLLTWQVAVAQDVAPEAEAAPAPPSAPGQTYPFAKGVDEWDPEAFFDNLSPEMKEKFKQNLERWKKLPPQQRDELRRNEEVRLKRMLKEVQDAIEQSGLSLDEEQRELFTFKYAQERRALEENLRREMNEKRREGVNRLIYQLVTEFQALPAASHP